MYQSDRYALDNSQNKYFDCLYAHIVDDQKTIDERYVRISHLIPFCRRPDDLNDQIWSNVSNDHITRKLDFTELYRRGVTGEQLLAWSVPVEIAQRYERYHGNINEAFFNCSFPWFGPWCQYRWRTFAPLTFSEIVQADFSQRSSTLFTFTTGTCYSLLPNCSRGSWPLCLDWREICDQKLDCLNGEDEEGCELLETSECGPDEYRCHYGGQCIPFEFLRDNRVSVDCLDASDENEQYFQGFSSSLNWECFNIPTFRCEERTGRYPRSFPCGDGEYVLRNIMPAPRTHCSNKRDEKLTKHLLLSFDYITDRDCREAFFCAINNGRTFGFDLPHMDILLGELFFEGICQPLKQHCHREWLSLPQQPFFFGLFQLIYFTNRSVDHFLQNIAPDLICFKKQQCPALALCDIQLQLEHDVVCCATITLLQQSVFYDFTEMLKPFDNLYRQCTTKGTELSCKNSSFFYCSESLKCIANHRVADGFQDCYYAEDEKFSGCHLNDSHRFVCLSNWTKCLSPVALGNGEVECPFREDETSFIGLTSIRRIPYSRICDNWVDSVMIDAEDTDETNCGLWPCSNIYTRCNKHWDCTTGIDELGCSYSHCASNEHECKDTKQKNRWYCLPFEFLFETHIDPCIHIRNERHLIFKNTTGVDDVISWNTTPCITIDILCRRQSIPSTNENNTCFLPLHRETLVIKPIELDDGQKSKCSLFTQDAERHRTPYFSPSPSESVLQSPVGTSDLIQSHNNDFTTDSLIDTLTDRWFCHRGISILSGTNRSQKCLCPPSYYGSRCQWQNQRISLTLFILSHSLATTPKIFQVIILLKDQYERITPSSEQITFVPTRDCNTKFNIYLLYPNRPKNRSLNYFVHIDVYERMTMTYWASWILPIDYPFLPVNRIVSRILIPGREQIDSCFQYCGSHGRCVSYVNDNSKYYCRCDAGYSGQICDQKHVCQCSNDSICLSSTICVCPLNKFGSQCYLKREICQGSNNLCQNGGRCVPGDDRMALNAFTCFCLSNYSGSRCEIKNKRFDIRIARTIENIDSTVLLHWITAFNMSKHERTTIFKKMPYDRRVIILFAAVTFNLLFIELSEQTYYMASFRRTFDSSETIYASINNRQRCSTINELVNLTILEYPLLRRIKYYPFICRQNRYLKCFYDGIYMCVCDRDRFSNCFDFYTNRSSDCQGFNTCENDGRCFQNNETCPTMFMCLCPACFYGAKCQFSTKVFTITLDPILGYHIKPHVNLMDQPAVVTFSAVVITLMLIIGFINGLLSIWTFRTSYPREIGCRYYLLLSSMMSMCTISVLAIKFWLLVFSQMASITSRSWLMIQCRIIDVLLKILLTSSEWLNACVAIDRTWMLRFGLNLDQNKRKRTAKRITLTILSFATLTHLHDPFHRKLIDDVDADEQRTWCFARFSSAYYVYNSIINIFHVIVPFSINLISAIVILVLLARTYAKAQPGNSFRRHLHRQLFRHTHLLTSPCILVVLGLPRLIITFTTSCMKSERNPWLFLIGYLLAFVPSVLAFVVFMLAPKSYRRQLRAVALRAFRHCGLVT